jgi:hypothetical protein
MLQLLYRWKVYSLHTEYLYFVRIILRTNGDSYLEATVRFTTRKDSLFSSKLQDRLWSLLVLIFNGYRQLFLLKKAAGAWSWPLTPSSARTKREMYCRALYMSSWGAQGQLCVPPPPHKGFNHLVCVRKTAGVPYEVKIQNTESGIKYRQEIY